MSLKRIAITVWLTFSTSFIVLANDTEACFRYIATDHNKATEFCEDLLKRTDGDVAANDRSRIQISMATIANAKGEFDQALQWLDQAISQNDYLLENNLHRYNWLRTKAITYFVQERFTESLPLFLQAKEVVTELKRDDFIAKSANDLASNYMEMGQFQKAMGFYKQSLDVFTQSKNFYQMGFSLAGIAIAHKDMGDFDSAESFFKRAIDAHQEHLKYHPEDRFAKMAITQNQYELAESYIETNQLQLASTLLEEAALYAKQVEANTDIVQILNAQSRIALAQNEPDEALSLVNRARDFEVAHNLNHSVEVYQQFVSIYNARKQLDQALLMAKEGLSLARESNHFKSKLFFLKWLGDYYSDRDNTSTSLQYFEEYLALYERFLAEKFNPALVDLRSIIQVKQQQLDIELLRKDKDLANAQINQRNMLIAFACVVIVLLMCLIILIRFKNTRQRVALHREIKMHQEALLRMTDQDPLEPEEEDSAEPSSKESVHDVFRAQLVELMNITCETWEHSTGKALVDLAEKSGIWTVVIDEGRLRTRTMDKYLNVQKLPKNPRWRQVIKTCRFVLVECDLKTDQRDILNDKLQTTLDLQRSLNSSTQ